MDIAEELAKYIADAGFGTVGTNVFVGQITADTEGVTVVRTGGTLHNYTSIEETVLDIYYKHQNAQTCIDNLEQIKRYIHRMHSTDKNDAHMYSILVIGDIEDVQRDLEYHKVYKITVQVLHRTTTLIS